MEKTTYYKVAETTVALKTINDIDLSTMKDYEVEATQQCLNIIELEKDEEPKEYRWKEEQKTYKIWYKDKSIIYAYIDSKYDTKTRLSILFKKPIQILFIENNLGIPLHAIGLMKNNQNILCIGHSGNGKSTLAKHLKDTAIILNDENIIITKDKNKIYAHSTPFLGDGYFSIPQKHVIKKVFILHKGQETKIQDYEKAQWIGEILELYTLLPENLIKKHFKFIMSMLKQIPKPKKLIIRSPPKQEEYEKIYDEIF